MPYRYILQPYRAGNRYRCPGCNHRTKTFSRYVNTDTGQQLADHVGRCGRENNCGYHFTPKEYFKENEFKDHSSWMVSTPKKYKPLTLNHKLQSSYIPFDTVNASFSVQAYNNNRFVQYLIKKVGFDKADKLVGRYRIGTSKHWPGATVFWQLDVNGNVRTGKIMLYDQDTGKRIKKPFNHITWAHSLLKPGLPNYKLKQCFFGEHLLAEEPLLPVAIVESEKTAIIASALLEGFVWLAAGGLNNLNPETCRILKGRLVLLFPDLNAYDKWKGKARELKIAMPNTIIKVFKDLERLANTYEKALGLDLGDVLLGE